MKFKERLLQGTFEKRYKRFFVDIKYNNRIITGHCPNSGSMMGLLDEGNRVWFSKENNPNRKLKFTLQIMEVSRRRWIIGIETSQEDHYDMYEETHLDWSYRLHVRNRIFLEDWMIATGLELEYDMFTGNHERDCSNFQLHEPDSREYPKLSAPVRPAHPDDPA